MEKTFYDIEVFKHGWSIVLENNGRFKTLISKFNNDGVSLRLKRFLDKQDLTLGGFNSKHYDNHILMALINGYKHEEIKELNDFIIQEKQQGWDWSKFPKFMKRPYKTFDLKDDLPLDLSLKAIEGNLGYPIVESSVSFDIDRPLTDKEWEEVIEYNKQDVLMTKELYNLRKSYFESKIEVGKLIGLEPHEALKLTNAKLASKYLGANKINFNDERNYIYPKELKKARVPPEVLNFFEKIHDFSIDDKTLWSMNYTHIFKDLEVVYGFGGVHGAIPHYHEQSTKRRVILNYDVASLYPNLMIYYDFVSRAVLNKNDFKAVVDMRLKAKHEGNKILSNALKLVINTTYGAMLNQYNDLYDPRMGRSVCITGQLLLTDLMYGLLKACSSLKVINFNTDGIMFSVDVDELDNLELPLKEWQERTHLELEKDEIQAIYQKDVNNYIMVDKQGKYKTKGGYVATYGGRGIENGSLVVVSRAIVNYFTKGISPKEYIESQNEVLDFQMIAKGGSKFKKVVWRNHNQAQEVQRVNRVYASKNKTHGTLYKIKAEDNSIHKIASLPDHCLIDNENKASVKDIDKEFYIDLAYKRILDYIGTGKQQMSGDFENLPKLATRKTYLKLNHNSFLSYRKFEKGDLIPKQWENATVITRKEYLLNS